MGTLIPGASHTVVNLLLGTDERLRLRLTRFLAATAVYAFCSLLALLGVWWGLLDVLPASVIVLVNSGATLVFYVALRTGWSQRLRDPALTLAQCGFAIASTALAYALTPPVRGAMPIMMALVLVFGAFMLTPRDCWRLGGFSVLMLGGVMLLGTWRTPEVFDVRIEVVHFLLSAVGLSVIAMLAGQLSELRALQQVQKQELRAALDRLQQLATHDELTGLPNRRQVMALLSHEERRAQRQAQPMCVALLDIDHFKSVNDNLGHQAGDEALRRFAAILLPALRAGDVLARWGGEEFILVLPATPPDEAARVLERLRLRCADRASWTDRPELLVSFSAGLSAHVAGEPTQLVIARADTALYQAKRSGRNRLEIA
ncbi:MAG: diguanylate cyclase [Rhodoferax sp.]|jgi:diguanylate cyclase (GGDEF)-like protein|nr:diguanylate cyclase [Rhodoferax sp.]